MSRTLTPERMDEPTAPRDQLARSLRFIRAVNRRLGGTAALLRSLDRLRPGWPSNLGSAGRPLRILDVGTGSADIPVAAVRWADRRGLRVHITAIDNHPTTLDLAREHVVSRLGPDAIDSTITLAQEDALGLGDRYDDRCFDYVHAGMFLHHLSEIRVLTALTVMDRLALRGIVWNDLLRSRLSAACIRVLTINAPGMVKHDARVSVEAGFTPREVRAIRERLSLGYTRLRTQIHYGRFVLAGDRPALASES